ncbi:type II secretion system protein [Planctomycetota bacterium]
MCRRHDPRPRGFTLIELLVVVAVIGILASLLMPAILGSMRAASATSCKSNLHQISIAFINYGKQYDLMVVPTKIWYTGLSPKWYELLEPYHQEPNLTRCPTKEYAAVAYGMNYRCLSGHGLGRDHWCLWGRPAPMMIIKKPSATVIFCDTGWVTNVAELPRKWTENRVSQSEGYCRFPNSDAYTAAAWTTSPWRPVPRHTPYQANFLFVDGHTSAMEIREVVGTMWGDKDCIYDSE